MKDCGLSSVSKDGDYIPCGTPSCEWCYVIVAQADGVPLSTGAGLVRFKRGEKVLVAPSLALPFLREAYSDVLRREFME